MIVIHRPVWSSALSTIRTSRTRILRPAISIRPSIISATRIYGHNFQPFSNTVTSRPQPPEPRLQSTWIDSFPQSWQPYMHLWRLDKPTGIWLLYWPCAWSITMASYAHSIPLSSTLYMTALFGVGAIVMRGAGCTINDLWDRDIDGKVERTRQRPIASGDLTPRKALIFLGGQLSLGLAVLTQLNMYSIALGASSLAFVVAYPLMKRLTYWPQAFLGITFNWGALLGWSAMTGSLDWSVALPLYTSGFMWTLIYDTIYAHQDKLDDVKAGVKSTAILFGDKSRIFISGCSLSMVSLLACAGIMNGHGMPFYLMSVGGAAAHLLYQVSRVDFNSRPDCWKMFASNRDLGAIVYAGMMTDYVLKLYT